MTCFDGNWNWNSIVATIPMQDSSGSLFVNWKPIFLWTEGCSDTRRYNNDDTNTVCSAPVSIFAAHIKPRHSYDNSRIKPRLVTSAAVESALWCGECGGQCWQLLWIYSLGHGDHQTRCVSRARVVWIILTVSRQGWVRAGCNGQSPLCCVFET